jgi:hypothetical protein
MRVCDSRAENNTRKESVCQVSVLGAPPCVHMRTKSYCKSGAAKEYSLFGWVIQNELNKICF